MRERTKAREVAIQILYGLDISHGDVAETLELYWQNFEVSKKVKTFATVLVEGTWSNRNQIDRLISSCTENWSLERLSQVDKSILRMAVYELLYCRDIPPKVVINEAIELGKLFGTENSGAFINGVLDALYNKLKDRALEENPEEVYLF